MFLPPPVTMLQFIKNVREDTGKMPKHIIAATEFLGTQALPKPLPRSNNNLELEGVFAEVLFDTVMEKLDT